MMGTFPGKTHQRKIKFDIANEVVTFNPTISHIYEFLRKKQ